MSIRKTNPHPALKSADKKPKKNQPAPSADNSLFDRVASILEQARGNVVRAVNTNMVLAYWLIGREIVEQLSSRLTERYGKGFSERNLQWFKQFYLAYKGRVEIQHPLGAESAGAPISYPAGTKSSEVTILSPVRRQLAAQQKCYPLGSDSLQGFSSQLTWSHYRALMRVESREARGFYERETVARYSLLKDRKQIFASKYMLCLPTEEQLRLEIEKERKLIDEAFTTRH